jgi:hypothetical protein
MATFAIRKGTLSFISAVVIISRISKVPDTCTSLPNEGGKRSWDMPSIQPHITHVTGASPLISWVGLFDLSLTLLIVASPFTFLFPPSSPPPPPTTPSSAPAPPPPPPPMQSRGADERPNRLSLIQVVRDLDKAVEGQPVAPPPPGPKSQMEWDEEVASPRPQDKVRQRVREVTFMYSRLAAAATAIQVNNRDVKTPEHGPCIPVNESRKGSVRNARIGIERRRKYEVYFFHPSFLRHH